MGPTTAGGHFKWLVGILAVIWLIWFFMGGAESGRTGGPFIKPPAPLDTGEIYGPDGTIATPPTPVNWKKTETQYFSIMIPLEWHFVKIFSNNLYLGQLTDGTTNLFFQYGVFANTLGDGTDPHTMVRNETIDGKNAIIVVPRDKNGTTTGVYFPNLSNGNKLLITGINLTREQEIDAVTMFRSIRFE